jgi:RNA polymerase sigma factor (sigma-70 family)
VDSDDRGVVDEIDFPGSLRRPQDAEAAIGALYQVHALGLIRLAYVMLGDRPADSAEALMLSGEERQEVMEAVRRLPARQREVLVLRFYLDLPDGEIAKVMGIGASTVRSAAARALETLGRALKELS